MKERLLKAIGVGLVVSLVGGSSAMAGKPAHDSVYQIDPTVLRDASGDVQQSDGLGPYAASQVGTAVLGDFATSAPDQDGSTRTQDYFMFTSGIGGSRTTFLSSNLASTAHYGLGSTQSIRCDYYGYFFFESAVTPDWYQQLGPVGNSVKGWGTTGCYTAPDRGYHFVYPGHTAGSTAGECLTMTQSGTDTLTLTAPSSLSDPLSPSPTCGAEVYSFVITNGVKDFTLLGTESAPFEIALGLPPTKGKSGKR